MIICKIQQTLSLLINLHVFIEPFHFGGIIEIKAQKLSFFLFVCEIFIVVLFIVVNFDQLIKIDCE